MTAKVEMHYLEVSWKCRLVNSVGMYVLLSAGVHGGQKREPDLLELES